MVTRKWSSSLRPLEQSKRVDIPQDLSALLHEIARDFPALLENNLVGVYLWGSLTYEAFDERCSDVDGIVVTHSAIDDRAFAALERWFRSARKRNPWTDRLDMRFVIDQEFLDKTSRCCGFQFGKLARHGSDGNPLIWINIGQSGITLWGKQAKRVAPEVTDQCLNDALLLELDYLKEDLATHAGDHSDRAFKHNAYAVLTACRIFYTAYHRTLVSKERASGWAMEAFPEPWRTVITTAKENRIEGKGLKTAKLEKEAMGLVRFVEAQTRSLLKSSIL